jgi:hypothetical protein
MADVAVRIYGEDFEKRVAAKEWLERMVPEDAEIAMNVAAERWEELDVKGRRFPWKSLLPWAAVAMMVVLLIPAKQMWEQIRIAGRIGSFASSPPEGTRVIVKNLSDKQKLLIGDPALSEFDRAKALYESDRRNPGFFIEYAGIHYRTTKKLPDGYFDEAASIDPDNAWYDFYAAASLSGKVVEKVKPKKGSKEVPSWTITDATRYRQALDLFRSATDKPRFEMYGEKMMRDRIALLPQANPGEWYASVGYLAGMKSNSMGYLHLSSVVSARVWELGEAGDADGLREMREPILRFIRLFASSDDHTLVGELIVRTTIHEVVKNFHAASVKTGIDGEDPRFGDWRTALDELDDKRKAKRPEMEELAKRVESKGSVYASLGVPVSARVAVDPPPVTDEDLMPSRRSDHATLSKIFSAWLFAQLVVIMGIVFAYRYRAPAMVRTMAARVEQLLCTRDWAWILAGGVLLPGLVMLALIAFTSFGGRDISMRMSMRADGVFFPAVQFHVLLLALILFPLLIARWRLRARAGVILGFKLRWVGVALVILSVIVFLAVYMKARSQWILLALSLPAQVWITVVSFRCLFSRSENLLGRIVMSRILTVGCAAGALLMGVVGFGFGALSQYWFDRDTFLKLSPELPSMLPYEAKVAEQVRKETMEVLRDL